MQDARQVGADKQGPTPVAIWAALLAVYIVWGSTYLAIRFAIESIPPFLMASLRFLIAGGVLYLLRRARGDAAPSRLEWRSAAVVGLFLLLGGNGGVVWAEQRVPSGLAALIVGTVPLWMVLIEALRPGGRRPGWQSAVGVVIGFVGIAFLIGPVQLAGHASNVDPISSTVLVVAALAWAIGSLYSRKAPLPASPLLGTGMEMLAGGLGLLVAAVASGELGQVNLAFISARSLLGFAFLVTFGSWVGFGAYTWLLRVAPTSLVSTSAYVNPVVAVFLGFLLGGEALSARTLVSAAIIVAAVAIITANRQDAAPRPAVEETARAAGESIATAGK